MTPSPFEVAQKTSNNLNKSFKRVQDENAIDNILSEAMESGDPEVLHDSIGKILSQVSPERQGLAVQFLQNRMQRIESQKEKQAKKQAEESVGVTPNLHPTLQGIQLRGQGGQKGNLKLNESLNQTEKRYKNRINAIKTPFEKRDAYGSIFLDFDEREKDKDKVLKDLDNELKGYAEEIANTYKKFGEDVPGDIVKMLKKDIMVNENGQQMDLALAEQINDFEKKYPASKHSGAKATDDEGNQFVSDGISWKLVK